MLYGTVNFERVENNGSLYSIATLPTVIAKINCCNVYHMAGAFIRYYKQLAKAARLVLAEKNAVSTVRLGGFTAHSKLH